MDKGFHLVEMTQQELKELFYNVIKTELEVLKIDLKPKVANTYLTRREVAEMFKIDLSSIHNWCKKGILFPYQIGNRVYFKHSEIEETIVKLKK